MTKEELKQEAEEWLCNNLHSASEEDFIKAMVDIAEPREKQIQIDAEQIRALQKQNGELTDELKDLRESIKDYGAGCYENGLRNGKKKLEAQIEKMKGYAKLLQDICTVMGNDPYMVSVGLENRVKVLWDSSEEKDGLKMVEDIENRLLKIKPQDWAEIEKWEIKEK